MRVVWLALLGVRAALAIVLARGELAGGAPAPMPARARSNAGLLVDH